MVNICREWQMRKTFDEGEENSHAKMLVRSLHLETRPTGAGVCRKLRKIEEEDGRKGRSSRLVPGRRDGYHRPSIGTSRRGRELINTECRPEALMNRVAPPGTDKTLRGNRKQLIPSVQCPQAAVGCQALFLFAYH
ncbi:Hypothetical protein NTJ_04857 [Nesidiocoris tenuis]|uniref:Uncharacterized protein n=1 Tax=Nesidiocoris tenuis TaxID=355587 RepID=A0ABN7AJB7_9HEMI|nr:Hypothetical protein NTJ_04857 [Nesidiocoris tenuis]